MTEDEARELVRSEIRGAFALMSADAGTWHTGYDSGDLESSAARVLIDVADRVMHAFTAPDPEPANPFEPKKTAQEWADDIKAVIQRATDDGYEVWNDNQCCGCSSDWMAMRIGTKGSDPNHDPMVWGTA